MRTGPSGVANRAPAPGVTRIPRIVTSSSPRSHTCPASTNNPSRMRCANTGDGRRGSPLRMMALLPPVGAAGPPRNTVARARGRVRIDRAGARRVVNHVARRPQLVTTVATHRVGPPTVEALVRRHISHALPGERDVARQDRASADAPGKDRAAADGIVPGSLDLAAIELVRAVRPDEARGVQQRDGRQTAFGRIENVVHAVAYGRDADCAERPALAQKLLAVLIAQLEQAAVNPGR